MTAPDARQSDELREAIAALVADDQAIGWQESLPAELAERIVALPEVTAWAEKQARARAAEELRAAAAEPDMDDVFGGPSVSVSALRSHADFLAPADQS